MCSSCIQLARREQTGYNNNVLPDFLHYSLRGFHPLVGGSGAATKASIFVAEICVINVRFENLMTLRAEE